MSFERIYTFIVDKCPHLAAKNTMLIHSWVKRYDTELDIIPAVEAATKRGSDQIRSFGFFEGFIQKQNERRLKDLYKPISDPAEKEAFICKALAMKQRKFNMPLTQADEQRLEKYEAEHGRVQL